MSATASSFQKKSLRGRTNLPAGTKLHNNMLLTSTGVPTLDALIGGGLPIGTVLLVEEDVHGSYAQVIRKLFLAQGVAHKQDLYVVSADSPPNVILKNIPRQNNNFASEKTSNCDLQIAWRYQDKLKIQTDATNQQFGHYFDMSHPISEEQLNDIKCTCYEPGLANSSETTCQYQELLKSIKYAIKKNEGSGKVVRICIASLSSPHWWSSSGASISWFLLALRALLRTSLALCVVTMPSHLFEETSVVKRIEHCCDFVIHLESFSGSDKEQNPMYKEYQGLLHVIKSTSLNSIYGNDIDTLDLAFKLHRKKFSIEKLHLPPDVSDTASRSATNKPLCSTGNIETLDF